MRLAWFVVAVAIAGAAFLAVSVERAAACSCALVDPRSALGRADGAFVGSLLSKRVVADAGAIHSSADPAIYTFRVEKSVKGDLGKTVEVHSAVEGASCGLESDVGERIGLLLHSEGRTWTSGLCLQVDPDALLAAGGPSTARPECRNRQRPQTESRAESHRGYYLLALPGAAVALLGAFALRRRRR